MVTAKSFAFAAFLAGRGYAPDRAVVIDAKTARPSFTFPNAPEVEMREYRRAIDFLNALAQVARTAPKVGAR